MKFEEMKLFTPLFTAALLAVNTFPATNAQVDIDGIISIVQCIIDDAEVFPCINDVIDQLVIDLQDFFGDFDQYEVDGEVEELCDIIQAAFDDLVVCVADCVDFECEDDGAALLGINGGFNNGYVNGQCSFEPVQECNAVIAALNPAPDTKACAALGLSAAAGAMALNLN